LASILSGYENDIFISYRQKDNKHDHLQETHDVMSNKPHILLTGASGAIGQEVLGQLFEQRDKFDITAFDLKSIKSIKILNPFKDGIEIVYGDISNFNDIGKVCVNKDYVIHLAAIIPPLADENPDLAFKVNTLGTENLIRNLEALSPEAFVIYSSSISVYGDRLENPYIKIDDPLNPGEGDEYAKTKISAEQIICSSKLDWSILRLTAIMGKHKLSKLMFHMPLSTSLEIATPEDTARALINAIEHKLLISGKKFNLGGGENCRTTYKEFLTRSFEILGLGKLNFPQKAFAEKNFHCGFYDDGDDLEKILHFRNDTMESYFRKVRNSIPLFRRVLSFIFKKQIKNYLLGKSEPYRALITGDTIMFQRYYKTPENINK
jgi:nucleoside-diphosphate-sugar epimerase